MQNLHYNNGMDMQTLNLRELRLSKGLTQKEASLALGLSLRSYVSYENETDKTDTLKYRYLYQELEKINLIDEDHGILSVDQIKFLTAEIFAEYQIAYCYLFGSYARGTANEGSDVDLLISSSVSGLKFFELNERLRQALQKRVDLLDMKQLVDNESLLDEILKDSIKIYG